MSLRLQVFPIYLVNHFIKIIAQKMHFLKIRQQKIENLRIYQIFFFILFDVTPQKTIWCVPRQLIKSKRGPSPCIKTEERYMKPFPFLAWHHFFSTEVQLPTVNKKANPFQGWLFVILFFFAMILLFCTQGGFSRSLSFPLYTETKVSILLCVVFKSSDLFSSSL